MLKKVAKEFIKARHFPPMAMAANESALLEEFKQAFASRPQTQADSAWDRYLNQFRDSALRDDPRKFLRWGVIEETMCVSYARFLKTEMAYLKKDWGRWSTALVETAVGDPVPYLFHARSSGNLIHHAYHLARFQASTGCRIDELDVVYEFGGGYGCACKLLHALGFKGRYIIQDFPYFSALQRYYLGMHGIHAELINEPMPVPAGRSLFLAEWSLSEAPALARGPMFDIARACDHFLIGYQPVGGGVDNAEYFGNWQRQIDATWSVEAIAHLPPNQDLFGAPTR